MVDQTTQVEATKSTPRGVQTRGEKHMKDVTTYRIRPNDGGMSVVEGASSVVAVTAKSADVKFAASGTRAMSLLTSAYSAKVADAIAAAGSEWAQHRGSKRVWDIDLACAVGFDRSPEGAAEFRKSIQLPTPSTPWPSRVSETPDAKTLKGTIIDPATGRIKSQGATIVIEAPVDTEKKAEKAAKAGKTAPAGDEKADAEKTGEPELVTA